MRIVGLDLDNTLACYDGLFRALARERGLIPDSVGAGKNDVRDWLRARGREDDWTELQGEVYGPGMERAKPFPGALDFVRRCRAAGARPVLISHRTLTPFRGKPHDLHASARQWLAREGFHEAGLAREDAFLETSKQAKLARIASVGCGDFVDDLPEFLAEAAFPAATRRWLFGAAHDDSPFPRLPTWDSAAAVLLGEAAPNGFHEILAGLKMQGAALEPVTGAANNRVFRARPCAAVFEPGGAGTGIIVKQYFRHPGDPRDRLGAEWRFSRYAWDLCGLRALPQPLACRFGDGLAAYAFVEGQKPSAASRADVDAALEFLRGLQKARAAADLPDASEACFSVEQHAATVERRVERLSRIKGDDRDDREAREFARELSASWKSVKQRLETGGSGQIPAAERLISPSDFGFHNALRTEQGLFFLDFEYAGWDDTAKLVCDFFLQPAVPAPMELFDAFAGAVAPSPAARRRMDLLLPAYRIKWCCILLNEFSDVGAARRAFAAQPPRKKEQLAKARRLLASA